MHAESLLFMLVLMFKIIFFLFVLDYLSLVFLILFFCYSLWFYFAMKFKMKSSLHLLKKISLKTWMVSFVCSTTKVGLTRHDSQISQY